MKKHWFMSILAGLVVVVVGTAIASVPNGSSTSFNAQDPAVGMIASGQSRTAEGISSSCGWGAEKLVFCHVEELDFTPSVDGACMVNLNLGLVGEPMGEKGKLENVAYGIGERVGVEDIRVDENGVTAAPTYQSFAVIGRSRLVPVKAGTKYSFEPWVHSLGASHGTAYWDLDYVCFGA